MTDLIFLNGPSSSGKTQIAKCLQNQQSEHYLYFGIDAFMSMMPEKSNSWDQPEEIDGFYWQAVDLPAGQKGMRVQAGEYGQKVELAFREVVITLLNQGLKLIVDNVIDGVTEYESWKKTLSRFSTCFVGVICPLDELTRRERARGDRIFGSAAEQFYRTHENVEYDLVVKTDRFSSVQCAGQIIDYLGKA